MNTKDKILNVTEKLLIKKGLSSLSMREIAKKSNIVPSVLYHHFNNKSDLIRTFILTKIIELEKEINYKINKKSTRKTIEEVIFTSLKHGRHISSFFIGNDKNNCLSNKFFKDLHKLKPKLIGIFYKPLIDCLNRAIKKKEIKKIDPEQISRLIIYTIKGFGVIHMFDKLTDNNLKKFSREYTNLIFKGIEK